MNNIAKTILVVALAGSGGGLLGQAISTHADLGSSDAYSAAKEYLDKYHYGSDMPDAQYDQARRILLAKGAVIVPSLIRLFRENKDDQYRNAIINILLTIEGGQADAVQVIESELSKDPEEWRDGKRWIAAVLGRLPEIDPVMGRWICLRALELDDDRLIRSRALGRLEKIGQLEDVEALERFKVKRSQQPPAGELRDLALKRADSAIRAIKFRAEKERTLPAAGGKKHRD